MAELQAAATTAQQVLTDIDGAINTRSDFSANSYQFMVDVDREAAAMLGLSMLDIQREVNLALSGAQASVLRLGSKEYDIQVVGNTRTKDDLENLAIRSSLSGGKVLLKQIGAISLLPETAVLTKYNRDLAITISADLKQGYSSARVVREFRQAIEEHDLRGVRIDVGGEMALISESFGYLGYAALLAVFIVYIILMVQFNSLTQPLIIMLTVPLAVIGGVLGLVLFRQPLSFSAMLGMVSLLGIVVNNAIVLVDFINEERSKGADVMAACRLAVEKRFRPVILSTTTTVIGLSPLVLSADPTFMPMAIAVMAGLMASTLLTLVVIPIIYSITETYSFGRSRLGQMVARRFPEVGQ